MILCGEICNFVNVTLILLNMTNIANAQNPFFEKYTTPYGTVPFDKIKNEHYEPAIREGISRQAAEIDAIVNNPEAPTFANTILMKNQESYSIGLPPYSAICAVLKPMMTCRRLPRR